MRVDGLRTTDDALTVSCDDPLKLISDVCVTGGREPFVRKAKWDTGATVTCISHELARDIGVEPDSAYRVATSNGTSIENGYRVGIVLPNGIELSDVSVLESDIHGAGVDVLIGMDVMTLGDFSISSCDGHTQFTFRIPSRGDVDFCDEM